MKKLDSPTVKEPSLATESIPSSVDALFEQFDQPGSPGCALGVMRDGQLIYSRGYGLANLEYSIPITPAFDAA